MIGQHFVLFPFQRKKQLVVEAMSSDALRKRERGAHLRALKALKAEKQREMMHSG